MKIFLECLPCFLRQALEAVKSVSEDVEVQEETMQKTIDIIKNFKDYKCSPEIGREIHRIVKECTGVVDPYEKIKNENIKTALDIYPVLKHFLYKKEDKLYWALKTAATGNIIDSAIYKDINIEKCVENELEKSFSFCDIEKFKNKLKKTKNILIIADNAGETVFDKVLVEELLYLDITYAVRSEPIINDATAKEACDSGLDTCTTIISSGCNAPGTIIEECSENFKDIYDKADLVISKGQGNFESLSDEKREIFFLLKAKCPAVAERLGVNVNEYVLKCNS